MEDSVLHRLPDGSGFFVGTVADPYNTCAHCHQDLVAHHWRNLKCPNAATIFLAWEDRDPVMWNPFNKVVQDHRDGTIHHERTNAERALRDLPTPWTPQMAETEVHKSPVY